MKKHEFSRIFWILFFLIEALCYLVFLSIDLFIPEASSIEIKYLSVLLNLLAGCLFFLQERAYFPILLALLGTAVADYFLLVANSHFLLGISFFIIVQLLYLLFLKKTTGKSLWIVRLATLLAVLFLLLVSRQLTLLNLLCGIYISLLFGNFTVSLLHCRTKEFKLLSLGFLLFLFCDLCVGLYNILPFSNALFWIGIGMWFFYLPSQVLISSSCYQICHLKS